jgi:hypothetical protein
MGDAARRKVQNQFNGNFVVKAYLAGLEAAKQGIRC